MSPSCERCGGTGWERVDKDGREFVQRCACRRVLSGPDAIYNSCRIPPRYEHCNLGEFKTETSRLLAAAREKCFAYVANYPGLTPEDEGLGLLFTGGTGIGKTHLAVSVLRELVLTQGARGQFWDFNELIREIKDSYNPETKTTEVQVLAPIVEMDVLVLDDLGAWKMTDWMNDTLFYILNSRYLARRATIITTNFMDADRETVLKADPLLRKEFLVERIGQRLRSRLMEMCVVIPMQGEDHRQRSQEARQAAVRFGGRT
jgi:DNA replication protein DnaC